MKHGLQCEQPMEKNFYSKNLPKQLVPTQELWPLACFHCGSADGSEVNATLAELHTTVYPQCSGCRGKKVKVVTAGKKKKNTAAPDARSGQHSSKQVWMQHEGLHGSLCLNLWRVGR